MKRRPDLYEEIVRMRAEGLPAALCTVLLTRGSTPGKEAMKMLVREDGTTLGTVGGGCVENDVIRMALEVLGDGRPRTRTFTLNQRDLPESGLICGGQVTILAEAVTSPVLVLFGGGHVSAAIARVARECDLRIVVCDPRAEYARPEAHPGADECLALPWDAAVARVTPARNHYLVVATRGHKDDLDVLLAIQRSGCTPRYLGLLGSRSKKATLERILADEGAGPEFLASIHTPIGLPIGAATPGEIAVSLMAELVSLRRRGEAGPASDGSGSSKARHQAGV